MSESEAPLIKSEDLKESSRVLPTLCEAPSPDFPLLKAKVEPEDFIVEEIPQYEPCGLGDHVYFWVEKRQLNTMDVTRKLAGFLKKRPADAGVAGLKDAQAITRQWISFEHVTEPNRALEFVDPQMKILKVSKHGNKLKMGHLRGNRFVIRLRPANSVVPLSTEDSARVLARAQTVLATLSKTGMPNYFGAQRFGRGGDNVELGRKLVCGDLAGFEQLCIKSGMRRPPDRKLRNLLVNAFQSELFNQVLTRRMPEIGKIWAGDLALLHRNGAVFAVSSVAEATKEQPRADVFEISPSGPMFGPKMPHPTDRQGAIEAEVLAASGVSCEAFGSDSAERQPGVRRALRIGLLDTPEAHLDGDGDKLGLVLSFSLPAGTYASIVIREILGDGETFGLGEK